MSREEARRLTDRVVLLASRLAAAPRLQAELHRARRQFFGSTSGLAADAAAEHRFVEWFLLERESESLGVVPATVPPYDDDAQELEDSIVGAYQVVSIAPSVTATDLQDGMVYELEVDDDALLVGDLLVGRLYPGSGERWLPSVAAPVLRPGRQIAEAFSRDLARMDLDRRLQQIELEHLLLRQNTGASFGTLPERVGQPPSGPTPVVAGQVVIDPLGEPAVRPLEHLEADLDKLLRASGDRFSAVAVSQSLADTDRPGPLLGPLLEALAFDTDIDLDVARRLLMEIWNVHHAGRPPSTEDPPESAAAGPPGLTLGEQLLHTLDEGLGEKRDVEDLFAQLESIAGIEPDEEDDEFDVAALGDFEPLVTEYLWENEREADAGAAALELWIELQHNAPVPHTDFESIAAADMMRLLLHVYLRATPTERATEVRAAFAEVRRFYEWVATTHEIDRRDVLQECRGVLLEQLDRLQAASAALSTAGPPERRPGILQVEDVDERGFGVRDDDGGHHWLIADAEATRNLRVGDMVLGALAPREHEAAGLDRQLQGLCVVLPIDARSLIE